MEKRNMHNKKGENTKFFFETLDRRLNLEKQNIYRFQVGICGYVIEFRFPSKEHAKWTEKNMAGQIRPDEERPNAVFQFWTADPAGYVGEENALKNWEYEDEEGHIWLIAGRYLIGTNMCSGTFYCCSARASIKSYWDVPLFYRWAEPLDMLPVHGAVVGVDGKGVMIASQGGGGKSTLAVSCLLSGFEFVSDDLFLINRHGVLRAMPIYKTVRLHVDAAERIKPDMPIVWRDDTKNGKQTIDISSRRICEALPIYAMLFPRVTEQEEPLIIKTSAASVFNEFIHSTLQQFVIFDYREIARTMLIRFKSLPVYEIRLCKDIPKNVEILRRFIEKEIKNV